MLRYVQVEYYSPSDRDSRQRSGEADSDSGQFHLRDQRISMYIQKGPRRQRPSPHDPWITIPITETHRFKPVSKPIDIDLYTATEIGVCTVYRKNPDQIRISKRA